MKKVKALICTFGLMGLLLAGSSCGDDPTKDMEKLVDKICACEDAKCLEEAQKEMVEMGKKYAEKGADDVDAESMKKMAELSQKMAKCMQEVTEKAAKGAADDAK